MYTERVLLVLICFQIPILTWHESSCPENIIQFFFFSNFVRGWVRAKCYQYSIRRVNEYISTVLQRCQGSDEPQSEIIFQGVRGHAPPRSYVVCLGCFQFQSIIFPKFHQTCMIFSAFDSNFLNQGVRMKSKETELRNNKIHAFVSINPFWELVEACVL